jgi:hypothetical protein
MMSKDDDDSEDEPPKKAPPRVREYHLSVLSSHIVAKFCAALHLKANILCKMSLFIKNFLVFRRSQGTTALSGRDDPLGSSCS